MLGYETNYAKDNTDFSRAYLFNFLPFYHSGLRVTCPVNDKVTVMYMLTNGIQQTEDFNDFKSNHFAAIVKPVSQVTWTANYYFGQEQPDGGEPGGPDGFFRVFDTYVAYTATSALTLGLDVNYVTNEVQQADAVAVAAGHRRLRALSGDRAGRRSAFATSGSTTRGCSAASTRSCRRSPRPLEYKFADGFLVRGEFRRDWSNQRVLHRVRGAERPAGPPEHAAHRRWCGGSATSKERGERHGEISSSLPRRCLFFVVGAAYVAGCRRLQ